ncbi:hypothetical protein [Pelagicoccus sp. SDUM812005]|uniref:hypothetical protein n=1 Tax=Pelagicoccus sp. SDUM812005 TaxID=3041257 RepID=UPI00280C5B32|nr:hypothetical protein [Pelagicoccus sp. SDUM812005]MDQ8183397.1 hypothetical protein [Pelagicoccus sp. SDUM812005]
MIKLSKKASSARSYDWRPNFRDYDSLPDMRAVRTQFFVPALAIAIASVLTVYILFQEYRASNIEEEIQSLQAEISTYQGRHDEKVKLNAEFMKISRTLAEVVEFKDGKLVASDALLSLSSNLLDGMHLDRVEYYEGRANIQGSVLVAAEEASRLVNDYLKAIEKADSFQGLLNEYKLTSLERSTAGNGIAFRIEVIAKEEGK